MPNTGKPSCADVLMPTSMRSAFLKLRNQVRDQVGRLSIHDERTVVFLSSMTTSNPSPVDQSRDGALIELLAVDPRVGVLEASRRLGAARGTVQARLDRMRDRGVITGYGPDVNPAALGYEVTAFITLEIRQAGGHDPVAERLAAIPEVLEVHPITGAWRHALPCGRPHQRRPAACARCDRVRPRRGPRLNRHFPRCSGPRPVSFPWSALQRAAGGSSDEGPHVFSEGQTCPLN